MSYSPALGRFLETDPEPYSDGMNLYEAVRSSPPNLLDPLGTTAITIPEKPGPVHVGNVTLPNGAAATVSVWSNTSITADDDRVSAGIVLRVRLNPELPQEARCNARWIQIYRTYVKDKDYKNIEAPPRDIGDNTYIKAGGDWYVDTRSKSPYYDTDGLSDKDDRGLTIVDAPRWDIPSLPPNAAHVYSEFDDYLVSGNNVLYHVHWEFWRHKGANGWEQPVAAKVSGGPVTDLPAYLKGAAWKRGYSKDGTPILVDNPLAD